MNGTDCPAGHDLREVEAFLFNEARLLDERKFEEWSQLFTPDGYYWAPARLDQEEPWTEVSLMFDDLEIMRNRIARLRHPKVYAQLPASRAVRQVSNITVDSSSLQDGHFDVRSVLFVFEYRPTLPEPLERTLAGHVVHRLAASDAGLRIAMKKVSLVNCDSAFDSLFFYY